MTGSGPPGDPQMAAHESARTTGLDRRNGKILRSKVERVGIWKCTRAGPTPTRLWISLQKRLSSGQEL